MHKMKQIHTKIIIEINNQFQICIPSVQFTVKKKNSNETKLFSSIKFNVLDS